MKLLTLNCHSWREENQLEKIKYLAKTIVEKNYDVIALQEVSQSIEAKEVYENIKQDNFALMLLKEIEKLGEACYSFFWDFSHIGYDIYEEGLAILSKHKIIETESFFISKNKDKNFWKTRKIIKATIDYNKENIDIYSCHLGWWSDKDEKFTEQGENLCSKVKESSNKAFIMGDFNNDANKRNEGYDFLLKSGLFDTYDKAIEKDEGYTITGEIDGWTGNENRMRLDIIFSNQPLKIKKSKVIFNGKNKEIISDHNGVEITV